MKTEPSYIGNEWNQPLERVKPEAPKPVDPDAYIPIPGRPGWSRNAKGQMAKSGDIPVPKSFDPSDYLVPFGVDLAVGEDMCAVTVVEPDAAAMVCGSAAPAEVQEFIDGGGKLIKGELGHVDGRIRIETRSGLALLAEAEQRRDRALKERFDRMRYGIIHQRMLDLAGCAEQSAFDQEYARAAAINGPMGMLNVHREMAELNDQVAGVPAGELGAQKSWPELSWPAAGVVDMAAPDVMTRNGTPTRWAESVNRAAAKLMVLSPLLDDDC